MRFASCDYNHDLVCRLGYESTIITEGQDISFAGIEPIFIPVVMTCKTALDVDSINTIRGENAYKMYFVSDIRSGKKYYGWANNISYDIAQKQAKTLDLQLKYLP